MEVKCTAMVFLQLMSCFVRGNISLPRFRPAATERLVNALKANYHGNSEHLMMMIGRCHWRIPQQ